MNDTLEVTETSENRAARRAKAAQDRKNAKRIADAAKAEAKLIEQERLEQEPFSDQVGPLTTIGRKVIDLNLRSLGRKVKSGAKVVGSFVPVVEVESRRKKVTTTETEA